MRDAQDRRDPPPANTRRGFLHSVTRLFLSAATFGLLVDTVRRRAMMLNHPLEMARGDACPSESRDLVMNKQLSIIEVVII